MSETSPETIECRVGRWYFKRMALMALMLALFAGWFFYDGKIHYVKSNRSALAEEAFNAGARDVSWDEFSRESESFGDWAPQGAAVAELRAAHAAGRESMPWSDYALKHDLAADPSTDAEVAVRVAFDAGALPGAAWTDYAAGAGHAVDPTDKAGIEMKRAFESAGQRREFAGYAAANDLGSVGRKYHTRHDIAEQLAIGGLCLAGVLAVLVLMAVNRGRVLRADGDTLVFPGGQRVPIAAIFRVDKRKWRGKGLAYVHYRDGDRERRATIDDLKFVGADKVLDRVLSRFHGDLVDRADDDAGDEDAPAADERAEPTGG